MNNRHHHHHLSLNHEGRWGTTDDFATCFLHFFLYSTALWDLANTRPVHSLMLSSHLFFCLPVFFPPFCSPLPSGTRRTPFLDVVFPLLFCFCLPCLLPPLTVPCKMVLARPDERGICPYHFSVVSLYDGQEACICFDCLRHLGTNFSVGNMVLV